MGTIVGGDVLGLEGNGVGIIVGRFVLGFEGNGVGCLVDCMGEGVGRNTRSPRVGGVGREGVDERYGGDAWGGE